MGLWQRLREAVRAGDFSFGKFIPKHSDNINYYNPVRGIEANSEGPPNDYTAFAERFYLGNSLVFMVAQTRSRIFQQATFKWQDRDEPLKLFSSPGLRLLERPWVNGTTQDLLARSLLDVDLCGNSYWTRELGYDGQPRLRHMRPDWIQIITTEEPEVALESDVAGYAYFPGGVHSYQQGGINEDKYPYFFLPEDVAHWSPLIDPLAQYRGISWMTPGINEVLLDKSTTKHKRSFFDNNAQLGVAVTVDGEVSQAHMEEFKKKFLARHQGTRKAHEPLFLGPGTKVQVIQSDLKSLDLKAVSGQVEERMAGLAGVPPSIVGLSEETPGTGYNQGNFLQQSFENFIDTTIYGLWQGFADAIVPLIDRPKSSNKNPVPTRLVPDTSNVRVLKAGQLEDTKVQSEHQTIIAGYITAGFTAESAVECVVTGNKKKLVHTGASSVQMQPLIDPKTGKPNITDPNAKDDDEEPDDTGDSEPDEADPDESEEDQTDDEPDNSPQKGDK